MDNQSGNKPKTKRRKVTVACDHCRARKVRCDGVQPVCGPCNRRSEDRARCIYTGELEKKRATQSYIARLENRLHQLGSPRTSDNTFLRVQASPWATSLSPVGHHANAVSDEGRKAQGSPQLSVDGDGNGVNAMMGAIEQGRAAQGFFGSSSAAGFMRQIKTAVDKRVASPDQPSLAPVIPSGSNLLPGPKLAPQVSADYVLPPRRTADSLMSVYWDYVFPLYPFINSTHIKAQYTSIWEGGTLMQDENMLMCTLNVIFALACQLADFITPEEREGSADTFFTRAKDLFRFNIWDTGSAALIQCLLLMAQYLQSTDSAHQCWIVTGLAIRNAQSLGLHLSNTISHLRWSHEKQLARKLWHGCVLMDRVISMTFGRPAMISRASNGTASLPLTVDDEFIVPGTSQGPAQPSDQPSIISFYAKTLELYEIMNDVLLSLYKPVSEDSAPEAHDFLFSGTSEGERTIFDLDRSLSRWASGLPPHLCQGFDFASRNPVLYRQTIVLRARFLHVRILLFRPTLSKYCTIRDNSLGHSMISLADSFPRRVALQCSIICVKVAQESIRLIYDNVPVDGTGGPLPAWWYNILYVYTAATVLVAGRLCPSVLTEVTPASLTQSWENALGILRKYQSYSKSARRCVAALEILYEQVASETQPAASQTSYPDINPHIAGGLNEISFGDGVDAAMIDGLEFPDFQDMSWLNSVPSNLF
ncbi:hypothetical protein N7492_006385 [Penicillium capsulatum]|uniref:Zn(2)-C6 fungal-type domain-containing protein n=1 Tax=Penicillium capsulatum TaxID=69766 RepID=A0A9W9I054_9EURO|nr:hypothetical protein N7492_006385 [Penicillium capsulatum]KAJ6116224.1 hypothetical protein N7512_005949 [Penicillium capsulatum]